MKPDIPAALLYGLASALGRLPWGVLRRMAHALAWLGWKSGMRESRVALRNLELAYPALSPTERIQWQRAVVRSTAQQTLETLRMWTRPHAANLALIEQSHGTELFDAAIASGKGVIVAAPHFGNWELLNQWLASRTSLAILYKPPESAIGEAFLRRVRANADAERITQIRAEGPGIRRLFKLLQGGGVVGILPDQQPKGGDGEFGPFFGVEALTMTLIGRLAERTGATVLFAWCERIDDGPGHALHFEPAAPELASPDARTSVSALNAGVERVARRDPAQYQWTYKRFKARPDSESGPHPYEDLERR